MSFETVWARDGADGQLGAESRRQAARVLAIARDELGMELAYLTEFVGEDQVIRHVVGDPSPFGLTPGARVRLAGSYCQRVVDGELDTVVPDTARNPVVAHLPATRDANLGAYVGIPVHLHDGRLYGTLCCANRAADPTLAKRETSFLTVLARVIAEAISEEQARITLEDALASRNQDLLTATQKLAASHEETVRRLSMAVEYRDDDTGAHVHRVGRLCGTLAAAAGLEPATCEVIAQAAPLHDVGKVGIPDCILLKPGPLDDDERAVMVTHAQIGHDILAGSESPVLQAAATIALTHHERFDGTGYPRQLAGEQIPVEGRITAIVDVYDALSSPRPYRPAWSRNRIFALLRDGRGSHFDPRLLDLFLGDCIRSRRRATARAGQPPSRARTVRGARARA